MNISILVGDQQILPHIKRYIDQEGVSEAVEVVVIDLSTERAPSESYISLLTQTIDIAIIDCGQKWGPKVSEAFNRSGIPMIIIANYEDFETYEHLDDSAVSFVFKPLTGTDIEYFINTLNDLIMSINSRTDHSSLCCS